MGRTTKRNKIPVFMISVLAAVLFGFILCSCSAKTTVTFDFNDGTGKTEKVAAAQYIDPVSTPERDGFVFCGWWTQAEGGEQWMFGSDKPVKGLVLYAHWSDNFFTVSFNTNLPQGESLKSNAISGQRLVPGSFAIKPAEPEMESDNCFFRGWSISASTFVEWDFSADKITADTELFAFWESYIILKHDLKPSPGQAVAPINDSKMRLGSIINLPETVVDTSGGHLFAGWYFDPGYMTPIPREYRMNSSMTVYAKWDETVTVTFDVNALKGQDVDWNYKTDFKIRKGNCLYDSYSRRDFEYDEIGWLLSGIVPVDKNHLFSVNTWYYDDGNSEEVFSEYASFTSDVLVYAQWREATYCIFDGQYRELFFEENADYYQGESEFTYLANLPDANVNETEGKYFVGWFYENNQQVQYFGEKVPAFTKFVSKSFTVTKSNWFEAASSLDRGYVANLNSGFTGNTLVIPERVYLYVNSYYMEIYSFEIDLRLFPNIKTVVFYRESAMIFFVPEDYTGIQFYRRHEHNTLLYDNVIYYAYSDYTEKYGTIPGRQMEVTDSPDYLYVRGIAPEQVLFDLTRPIKPLPVYNADYGLSMNGMPKILEDRFMPNYAPITESVLFCGGTLIAAVNERISGGFFSGSVAYPVSYLEGAKSHYLVRDNALIYYISPGEYTYTYADKIDLAAKEIGLITRINTASIFINYYRQYDIYIPDTVTQIESRAINNYNSSYFFFLGACPELVYRARNDDERLNFGKSEGVPQAWDSTYNTPFSNLSIYKAFYFRATHYDSYASWIDGASYSSFWIISEDN